MGVLLLSRGASSVQIQESFWLLVQQFISIREEGVFSNQIESVCIVSCF